jgi:hypothetical protein
MTRMVWPKIWSPGKRILRAPRRRTDLKPYPTGRIIGLCFSRHFMPGYLRLVPTGQIQLQLPTADLFADSPHGKPIKKRAPMIDHIVEQSTRFKMFSKLSSQMV